MSLDAEIELKVVDRIACISLNRPDRGNAINAGMAHALLATAVSISTRTDVRVALLRANGRFFSAGGDIQDFAQDCSRMEMVVRDTVSALHAAQSIFARMAAPVVAAVQGPAAGGGLGLAIGADFTLAAASATFRAAYTAIGLSGDAGVTYWLPRLVGLRRARELMLSNRTLTAQEALSWGLVDQVLPDEGFAEAALQFASTLTEMAPLACGACKGLLLDSMDSSFELQLAKEAKWMATLARSGDAQGAVQAFLRKRKPAFNLSTAVDPRSGSISSTLARG